MDISLIVPVFNEEKAIRPFYDAVRRVFATEVTRVELVFVNDGSQDASEARIRELIASDPDVLLIDLSRNFGKEAACSLAWIRPAAMPSFPLMSTCKIPWKSSRS
jgi:glycosyltransferase involved in cell wall biosynthesis